MNKTHYVATKLISYEIYGEILFQKVASGYLLHFAQDGSSTNALKKQLFNNILKNPKFAKKHYQFPPFKGPESQKARKPERGTR